MILAAASAFIMARAVNVWMLWVSSLTLGLCSIVPQLFVPMATFCAGQSWNYFGWTGVCCVGAAFAVISLLLSAIDTPTRS